VDGGFALSTFSGSTYNFPRSVQTLDVALRNCGRVASALGWGIRPLRKTRA